jgi:hypothetical protein
MLFPFVRAALLVGVGAVCALGCSPGAAERLRSHTYPPTFNYIPAEKLELTMWQLAERVERLDRRLRGAEAGDEALRSDVMEILSEMEQVTAALGLGGFPSNHPMIARNVESFRNELAAARRAVELTPPSYFLAGSISGACMHCHGPD